MLGVVIALLFSVWTFFSYAASPLKVEVSAKSAIVINAETGAILYQKNAHVPLYPASITKVITALYALEREGDRLDVPIEASYDAVAAVSPSIRRSKEHQHPPYRLEFGGSHMGIKVGETLSLRALFYGLMLASGNDAANVIAQHVSGSVSRFMEELNAFVKAKGCQHTVLHTPHGLPHPDHKTSAYDMAVITQLALQNPFFRQLVKTVKYERPTTNKQPPSDLVQHNALLKTGKFYYPKAIGVKTGYTLAGGYTLVAAAEDENRQLITVILGCEKLEQRYIDAIALFEAAFKEEKVVRKLFAKEFDHFSCSIKGGEKALVADLPSDFVLEYYPSEEPEFAIDIRWMFPPFPVEVGQKVAEVRVLSQQGKLLAQSPLFAIERVDSTLTFKIQKGWGQFKEFLQLWIALSMALVGLGIVLVAFYFHYRKSSKRCKN